MATVAFGDFEWDPDKAAANVAKHGGSLSSCTVSEEKGSASSLRVARRARSERPMTEDAEPTEPSAEELAELPEQDFSRAIRPNRYANLRGAFRHAVFLDQGLWEHFGSEERVIEALRLLVDLAQKRSA
jgi:hypothetical protein